MREALGKRAGPPSDPYPLLQETVDDIERKASDVRKISGVKGPELMEKLAEVSRLQGWNVCLSRDTSEALDYVCGLATSLGATAAVRSDQEVFQQVPIDIPLANTGVEVTVMAQAWGLSSDASRQKATRADISITGADYAIAETGTVVLLPRRGLSRLVSLAPPVHVCLVRPHELVETLEDVFILRRLAYYQGDGIMGNYMNFITGPSRTADIEQQLVVGVHGPKEAHMILLE